MRNVIAACKCIVCIKGKQTKEPFKGKGKKAENCLQLIHSDVVGPMPVESLGGCRYFVTFIDDSNKISVYPLKQKSEVFELFTFFKIKAEKQTGKLIKKIRSDNGGECINQRFENLCKEHGIVRMNFGMAKSRIYNGYEFSDVNGWFTFRRLDEKSIECIFVGYGDDVRGYRLHNPVDRKENDSSEKQVSEESSPKTYDEAVASNDSGKWKEAMNTEYESLIVNQTWELCEPPKDREIIKCKWVLYCNFIYEF